jgi:hypothetical protein
MVEEQGSTTLLDSLLFPRIFQAFRMSIQPTKLILAFLALGAVCLVGRVMDFRQTVVVGPDGQTELDEYVSQGLVVTVEHIRLFDSTGQHIGVFATLWRFGSARFHDSLRDLSAWDIAGTLQNITYCLMAPLWALLFHPLYSAAFFAVTLAAISLAGGALCRIAALQFARGEKPGLMEALRFSAARFSHFVMAPIIPFGIMAALGAFIAILGLLGNIPYVGELSVGLFLPLALILAVPITIFLIGSLAGSSLMFPALAYEDSDGFDAVSRSFSYVYAKPWHLGFYTAVAFIYGAICYVFVRVFSSLLIHITYLFLRLGFLNGDVKLERIWPQPPLAQFTGLPAASPSTWSESIGAFLIYVWVLVVVGLMASFIISFYFSAQTIIYALMRSRVDKTMLSEVHTRSDEMASDTPAVDSAPAESTPAPGSETDPAQRSETSG